MNVEGIKVELLIEQYLKGKSYIEIAKMYQITSVSRVIQTIKQYIMENNYFQMETERLKNINPAELYELREKGVPNTIIAAFYDLTAEQVSRRIIKYCQKNNLEIPFRVNKKIEIPIDEVKKDLNNGLSLKQIVSKYNISMTVLRKRLMDIYTKEELHSIIYKKYYDRLENSKDIIYLYEAGITKSDIVKYSNLSEKIVNKIISNKYHDFGKKSTKIIQEATFRKIIKGNTKSVEELQKEAYKSNRLIPTYLIKELQGYTINVNEIKEFFSNKVKEYSADEEFIEQYNNNVNLSKTLKEKKYDIKHQIAALFYKMNSINYQDIINLTCGDLDILKAILILNSGKDFEKNESEIAYNINKELNNSLGEKKTTDSQDNDER